MFQLCISVSFHLKYSMRLEFWDLHSQERFLYLFELRKCSNLTNLGDLSSVHFLPKGGWVKVGEITCYFSFKNILCITVAQCLSSSPAHKAAMASCQTNLWYSMDLAQEIAKSLFRSPSLHTICRSFTNWKTRNL